MYIKVGFEMSKFRPLSVITEKRLLEVLFFIYLLKGVNAGF